MRSYVTIVDRDIEILPWFLRWQRKLGADEFPILVYGPSEMMDQASALVREVGGTPIPLEVLDPSEFYDGGKITREAVYAHHHPRGEWSFFCDIDEFPQLDGAMIKTAINHFPLGIFGRWIDRFGPDGKIVPLPPMEPGASLDETFPTAVSVQEYFNRPMITYVLASYCPKSHHPERTQRSFSLPTIVVPVHHFKFVANVFQRLERRVERLPDGRVGWKEILKDLWVWLHHHEGADPTIVKPAVPLGL